jgi:rifampin ADP-ribosylating transferase
MRPGYREQEQEQEQEQDSQSAPQQNPVSLGAARHQSAGDESGTTVREVPDEMSWQRYYTGTRADLTPEDRFYHGTRAQLTVGDLIRPGFSANFGNPERITNHVYFSATLDAAVWGAELARGDSPGRIYIVEPTGPFTDDPNLTDKKFPGNRTKSYRSREAVRIIGEVAEWQGHASDVLQAMHDAIAERDKQGKNQIDD